RIPAVGVSSREIDLTQVESVAQLARLCQPSDVIVFASTITPDKGKDVRTLMRNLAMGEHVAEFLEKSACSHVVYVSSDAVYDDAANPIREDSPCNPASLHGVVHVARERMLAYATQKSKRPVLMLRSTLLYGPNDTHNGYGPNRFVRTALKERTIKLFGEGEEKRDHLYVRDLSRLIGACIGHGSEGVLDAATGHSASFREVADLVAACSPGTRLECSPRATPITHRHFDVSATLRAFPTMRFTPLRVGLVAMATTLGARAAVPSTPLAA
ncbi:MAG TPA: SDR family oxidoreductase, partial [Gemmataceae bacterium]|nr:SDR family oxidoreductase [Gemmataceae bacterium]